MGFFSKPTLDSVHTELACVRSLGRLHGSRISIRWEGERERGKTPSKADFKSIIGSQGPKTVITALRASQVRHRDAETSMHVQTCVYTETRLQTQRQLAAAGSEPHSCVLTHTCSTKARACVSVQAEQAQRYLRLPRGETSPSMQVRDTSHRCLHTHGDACARSWTHTPPPTLNTLPWG